MFIDNKVSNDIKECVSIPQLVRYLSVNRNMILAFQSDIFATIDDINKTCDGTITDIDKSYFDFFYHNRKEVTKLDYDFLTLYSNNILKYMINIRENMCCASLFLLLLDKNNIFLYEDKLKSLPNNKYEEILKTFYQKILDLYVPCRHPEEVVKHFLSIGCISDLLKISFNSDIFLKSIHKEDGSAIPFHSDLSILFKWISDIYSNDEVKFNTFKKLHYMETKSIILQDKIDVLEKRYEKYFKEYTKDLIYELLTIYNEDDVDNPLLVLIKNTKEGFPVDVRVIEAFLKDILEISIDYIDTYHYDRSVSLIKSLCNNGIYEYLNTKDMKVIESLAFHNELEPVIEAYDKKSTTYHSAQNRIYKAYKNYQNAEDKVDSQITKAVVGMKNVLIGDVKTEIIEGTKFSAVGLLKKLLATAALFSFGPIKAAIVLVIRYALKKQTTLSERKKIVMELETEIEMINEKIDDAKGDNNRQAKYAMMRTRTELNNALKRIKYGLEADEKSLNKAKSTINSVRSRF
jgi:hypothetical protein